MQITVGDVHDFMRETTAEVLRAIIKFPASDCCLAALTEEVGELAQAMLSKTHREIYKEAVQVAAMAARCAIEGDPSLINYRRFHYPKLGKFPESHK